MVAPLKSYRVRDFQAWMLSRSTLPRIITIISLAALVASAILLLGLSSDVEDLTTVTMSQPVTFTQFVCCNCYDTDPARIATTFFSSRRAVELHISRSKGCKAAGKGVRTVSTVYRESKRTEDQEAGPIGAPGQWPVRPAGGGGAAGDISSPISGKHDIGILRYSRHIGNDIAFFVSRYLYIPI